MISYVNSDLFKKDETKKELVISFDGGEIRNDKIYFEQFELIEKLCSSDNLMFGKCESSELKFKITNEVTSLKDKKLDVSMILNGLSENPFQVGKYKVYSDTVSGNRNYRNIVAYDDMYYILNADITSWYNSLTFPLTVKQLRNSLFAFLGVQEESQALINDNVVVEKTINSTELKGKDIIPCICELNGVFGKINRNGLFKYVSLASNINATIFMSDYSSASYDDFQTGAITGIQIRQEEGDVGVSVGNNENKYIIQGNFLCYGKAEDELTTIASNIFNKIKNIQYVPFNVNKAGNPCVEVGDMVSVEVKNKSIKSYVLERRLYGIQMLKDEYVAKGMLDYSLLEASLEEEIKQLKGKANILTRTIDETRSELIDYEEETSSLILQESNLVNISIKALEDSLKASDEATSEELKIIRKELDMKATSEDLKIEFEKERENGADSVVTSTGYTFNEDGLKIEKSDSEMSTTISEDGMKVAKSGEDVLTANSNGVDAVNLHAKTYLIMGTTSRFEDYYNDDGELRTGCFWIGDNPPEQQISITGISATYSGGNVPVGTKVSSLTGITVTARYSDGTTEIVTGYTLSGTIVEGNNTITITYSGKTTTIIVVGYVIKEEAVLSNISVAYSGGNVAAGTSVNSLTGITVTAHYSDGSTAIVTGYSLSGTIIEGNNTITVTYQGKTAQFIVVGIVDSSGGNDIVLGAATSCVAVSWLSSTTSALAVPYSDTVEIVDGVLTLTSQTSANFYQTTAPNYSKNNYEKLRGKYIEAFIGDIYYIDPNSTYEHRVKPSQFVTENIVYNKAYKVSIA